MSIEDGRGKHMKEIHAKNRATIVDWFKKNTGSMKDCSNETGISYMTVRTHVAELRVEQESR